MGSKDAMEGDITAAVSAQISQVHQHSPSTTTMFLSEAFAVTATWSTITSNLIAKTVAGNSPS
jgi:hypothetical protein